MTRELAVFSHFLRAPPKGARVLDGYTGKVQVQSLTQALPAWWNWRVVRASGVGTGGMGKRGRAENKGKVDGDLKGI